MPLGTFAGAADVGAGRAHHARLLRLVLGGAVALSSLVLVWTLFAPPIVGGPATYVVTDGVSMLPHYVADGLVITRTEERYHIGEVVAYHNKQLQAVVMHRIVARDGNRFVFKGDNNDFRDQYHPTKAELVGKEWIYLPGAGRYLLWLRNPATFALIIGLMALVSFRPDRRSRKRRRHHAR